MTESSMTEFSFICKKDVPPSSISQSLSYQLSKIATRLCCLKKKKKVSSNVDSKRDMLIRIVIFFVFTKNTIKLQILQCSCISAPQRGGKQTCQNN